MKPKYPKREGKRFSREWYLATASKILDGKRLYRKDGSRYTHGRHGGCA